VVLVRDANPGRIQPYLDQWQAPIPYAHMWWFLPQHYEGISQMQVLGDILNGHYFPIWRDYFIDRTVPNASQGTDMFAYFPKDFPTTVAPPDGQAAPASGDPIAADALEAIARHGTGEGEVNGPADVAVDGDGNVFIADRLNQRIVKITADGEFSSVGGIGNGDGQFADPYSDEYQVHDGPWGIATGPDGNVYVADTWNHRIQVFTSDLEFVRSWGRAELCQGSECPLDALFGPRDIAIDADGNVLVVDTGNKRIVKYNAEGLAIAMYGGGGGGEGRFEEPTSVSIAANGDIFVADYWNQRIQRFNANFDYIDEIAVPSWGSRGVTDRAYIAVLDDGRILATDPANGRIAVFRPTGEEEASRRVAEVGAASRPIGITSDGAGRVYIADAIATGGAAAGGDDPAGAVIAVSLEDILAPPAAPATP
jgi:DNA-binding beta-propeller fold protein YncE